MKLMIDMEILLHQKVDIDEFSLLSPETAAIIYELMRHMYATYPEINMKDVPMTMRDMYKKPYKMVRKFLECIEELEKKIKSDKFIQEYINKYYAMMRELNDISQDIHYFPLYIITANKWKYVKISRKYMPPDNGVGMF